MHTRFITLNGQRFHLREWGDTEAPLIVALHGFPEYSGGWTPLAEALADRYRILAPDQRGYGKSWKPKEIPAYRSSQLVRDIVALIESEAKGKPVLLMGHDWGASVAYALAISAPHLIEKLIILNGVHPIPFQRAMASGGAQSEASQYIETLRRPGSEDWLAADDFAKLMQLFGAKMDLSWMTPALAADYRAAWGGAAGLGAMINWYRASPLQVAEPGVPLADPPVFDSAALRVTMPHLLVWGTGDTALLPEAREGLDALCADLTIKEIDGADHWLIHQKPTEIAAIIKDWLS